MRIITLLSERPDLDIPQHLLGWIGFLLLLVGFIWAVRRYYEPEDWAKPRNRWMMVILMACVPLTSLLLGIQLLSQSAAPLPYLPNETSMPAVMVLSALPWMLAAGFLGMVPAAWAALFSAIFAMLWNTHHIYTLLELPIMALAFSAFIQQPYRTAFYRVLRHPVIASLATAILIGAVRLLVSFFEINGSIIDRLDYSITQSWVILLPRVIEILIAGVICEVFYAMRVKGWHRPRLLVPSPAETSIQKRYFYAISTFIVIISVLLIAGQWISAEKAARQMVSDRLKTSADIAIQTLPSFFETGQSLSLKIADETLTTQSPAEVHTALGEQLTLAPFFRELYLFNARGEPVIGYPIERYDQIRPGGDSEYAAIQLALDGIPHQALTLPAWPGETSAQVSFVTAIKAADGSVAGVLVARTDLESNPFTQRAVESIRAAVVEDGTGIILDETNRVLFHTAASTGTLLSEYEGDLSQEDVLFSNRSPSGTRQYTYLQRGESKPWTIVLSVPARQAQEIALDLAVPLLGFLALVMVGGLLTLRFGLRQVTSSLQKLASQTTQMTAGKLDTSVTINGEDEVGRLGAAFEQMRLSLKARLEELNRLLTVSQSVAANLDVERAILPVLEAAIHQNTSCVRAVLVSDVALDAGEKKIISFGVGPGKDLFPYLDDQLFNLMRTQDVLPIPNTTRIRRLELPTGKQQPGALLSLPIRHENEYYGALWIGYESPHAFTEEEVRFYTTLAGEVAMAAANSRLYATAEIGRQRLEAVLASTPDPVLVFDSQEKLFLLNPAAIQVPGLVLSAVIGTRSKDVVGPADLLELLNSANDTSMITREISLVAGKVYYASVSPVLLESQNGDQQNFGKICLLRDITHFKELDTLKSDFVATVSHDLRSPLTLMRGYATMLPMVGELTDQQKNYVQKMVGSVDNMSRLVNNLLDLGRIEAGIDLKLETVNPVDILEQVVNNLQAQAAQKTIQMQIDSLPKKMLTIQADPALLQQAIHNLVENAIKYTPVNGLIKIRLNVKMDKVVYEVQDTGIGVAPLDLPRVFEKFYRSGRREAYAQKGTGLGLAIVKSVVERHNGRVWVESQLGKGSTFYMELPIKQG